MPVVTVAGVQVGGLLGGSVVVESVFRLARPRPARVSIPVCPRSQSAARHLLHLLLSGGGRQHRRGRRLRAPRSARQGRLMQGFWRRFIGNPRVALGLVVAGLHRCGRCRGASCWHPRSPFAIVSKPFSPPFGEFLFGTDSLGRSLLAGLIHGARTSLLIAIIATLAAVAFGTLRRCHRRLLRRRRRRRAHARQRVLPDHPLLHLRHRAGCNSRSLGRRASSSPSPR